MDRFSGSLGTLAMTITAALTGSSRAAILAVIGFFVIGLVLLRFVDIERGRLAAREAERLALTTGRPAPPLA
jgi:UMF1 family MFS transporter